MLLRVAAHTAATAPGTSLCNAFSNAFMSHQRSVQLERSPHPDTRQDLAQCWQCAAKYRNCESLRGGHAARNCCLLCVCLTSRRSPSPRSTPQSMPSQVSAASAGAAAASPSALPAALAFFLADFFLDLLLSPVASNFKISSSSTCSGHCRCYPKHNIANQSIRLCGPMYTGQDHHIRSVALACSAVAYGQ